MAGGVSLRVSAEQSCTVLFEKLPTLDNDILAAHLDPWIGPCYTDVTRISSSALLVGTVNFDLHRVVLLGMPAAVSKEALARTVGVSPMPEEMRAGLMDHQAAVRLLYVGDSDSSVEQLTALHSVAGALMEMGGVGLLNERAALALPAALAKHYLSQLGGGTLPIELWVGAVTFRIEDGAGASEPRYLIRTYGMEQMRLPDLGMIMREQSQADDAYRVLLNVCLYMAEGSQPGEQLAAGDRVDFGGRSYLLTEAGEDIGQYAPGGRVLVVIEV
jgi:hypothetical protein